MSDAAVTATPAPHPVGLIVTDDLQRSRLTVFFRLLLAIPQLVWLALWGIATVILVIVGWFAAVVTGRLPDGIHAFLAAYLRYATHVNAYVLLLAEPWPPFVGNVPYPIDLRVDPAETQSRLTVGFRIVLAIPALILSNVFRQVNDLVAFLAWFFCLATGHMHEGMRNLSAWLFRYELQTYAYVMLLTGRYPSLAGAPTA
jgi:hypothetical protein